MTPEEYGPRVKLVAAILVTVLIVLMPLAHASPVDPSSPGFWDNADLDDVVLFLTLDLHFLDIVHGSAIRPSGTVSERVFKHPTGVVAQHADEPGVPRAPPAAD
jgi:hypothetical protein